MSDTQPPTELPDGRRLRRLRHLARGHEQEARWREEHGHPHRAAWEGKLATEYYSQAYLEEMRQHDLQDKQDQRAAAARAATAAARRAPTRGSDQSEGHRVTHTRS